MLSLSRIRCFSDYTSRAWSSACCYIWYCIASALTLSCCILTSRSTFDTSPRPPLKFISAILSLVVSSSIVYSYLFTLILNYSSWPLRKLASFCICSYILRSVSWLSRILRSLISFSSNVSNLAITCSCFFTVSLYNPVLEDSFRTIASF